MHTIRHYVREDDGIALVMAIGILAVLLLGASSVVFYSSSNSRSAEYSRKGDRAYGLAEAGANYARAIL